MRYSAEFVPVVFVDDNPRLWGSVVLGLKVRAPFKLPRLVARHEAGLILLALPSTSHRRRREILESLAGLPARVMALPTLAELTSGARRIDEFREIDVADILGRDSVQPDDALLRRPRSLDQTPTAHCVRASQVKKTTQQATTNRMISSEMPQSTRNGSLTGRCSPSST